MATRAIHSEQARFDTRLPKEQKALFEKAAILGGYRNLTDFLILAAQEKATKIIEENEKIIASQKDSEIFFNAIMSFSKPNSNLTKATEDYKSFLSE